LEENSFSILSFLNISNNYFKKILLLCLHVVTEISVLQVFSSSNTGDVHLLPGGSRSLLLFTERNLLQARKAYLFNLNDFTISL